MAKAGNPVTLNTAESTSLEIDSLGNSDSKVIRVRAISSLITCTTEACPPSLPNRLNPESASKAALAIPIELALSSAIP